jgi:hypothetical protein
MKDYRDTADLLSSLNLVISVDTPVAHLAGALGVPTWMPIPFCPDWRWMSRFPESTPWYRSLRLFRQPAWHDWDSVLAALARDLHGSCGDWNESGDLRPAAGREAESIA